MSQGEGGSMTTDEARSIAAKAIAKGLLSKVDHHKSFSQDRQRLVDAYHKRTGSTVYHRRWSRLSDEEIKRRKRETMRKRHFTLKLARLAFKVARRTL